MKALIVATDAEKTASWKPSYNTEMSLRQLGYTQSHLQGALSLYLKVTSSPDDKDFVRFVSVGEPLNSVQVPTDWEPNGKTRETLVKLGYREILIDHAVKMFILRCRESKSIRVSWEASFIAYTQERFPTDRGAKPLAPSEWTALVLSGMTPEQITLNLKLLSDTGCSLSSKSSNELYKLLRSLSA